MNAAHLHLLVNHLPVIGALFAMFLLAWAALRRNSELTRAGLGLFVVAALAGLAAYYTGEPAEDLVERLPGVTKAVIHQHEETAELATILLAGYGAFALGALVYFWKRTKNIPRGFIVAALLLGLIPAGAMALTANQGGEIRHTEIRPASANTVAMPESDATTPPDDSPRRESELP